MLSVEALQESVMLDVPAEDSDRFAGCVGGDVSEGGGGAEHADVDATTCAAGDELPAASFAATENVYAVPHASPVWEDEVVLTVATFTPLRLTS
jgi:hypothetical protein